MKYTKLKAFTLAEVMILLLTLSILLAAMAPVFTTRSNAAGDEVWSFVGGDDEYDAYYDSVNKNHTAQAFIGLTPSNKMDVTSAVSDGTGANYSKLVVRASDKLNKSPKYQHQMQFRYGNSAAGDLVGSLFAGNGNMLVGGIYNSLTPSSTSTGAMNTSFGAETLSALTTGNANTAGGAFALNKLTKGSYNTAVGYAAARSLTTGSYNTAIGPYAGESMTSGVTYNTLVGDQAGRKVKGNYNTVLGSWSMTEGGGSYNTVAGNHALVKLNSSSASYNTAIGYQALSNLTSGSYNTAVGMNSCLSNTSGSYVTCIGYNSGSTSEKTVSAVKPASSASKTPPSSIFSGSTANDEVVLIGSMPLHVTDSKSAAVIEVHNNKTTNGSSAPINNIGNETVVINGNLVVRGASYIENVLYRPVNTVSQGQNISTIPKGLIGMKSIPFPSSNNARIYLFAGYDGNDRSGASYGDCNGCRQHVFDDIRTNCICTAVGGSSGTPTSTDYPQGSYGVSRSYDWTSKASNNNGIGDSGCSTNGQKSTYTDLSYSKTITLERTYVQGNSDRPGTDQPYAHWPGLESCCPDISSDIRLKNVGASFTAGLNEIKNLNVYNFTFKNDQNKIPQVGVMAQDLKKVFPNAVSKDKNGYYQIRWDEMFYAAINAVKSLNTKVQKIAAKVTADRNRVAALKQSNSVLNERLDNLVVELEQLESKK